MNRNKKRRTNALRGNPAPLTERTSEVTRISEDIVLRTLALWTKCSVVVRLLVTLHDVVGAVLRAVVPASGATEIASFSVA